MSVSSGLGEGDAVNLSLLLAAWVAVSVPASLLVGSLLHATARRQVA
jgi:hypothetical protein